MAETSFNKGKKDKRMSLREAVGHFIQPGCSIANSGFGNRAAYGAYYEIIRQGIKDLTMIVESDFIGLDVLVGAGCVKRIEGSYFCIGVPGLSANIRRSVEKGIPHRIEIEDWSNYTSCLRMMAGAFNVPYIPAKSLLGSDIPGSNPKIRVERDSVTGEKIALIPAVHPDVAVIHVQRADKFGNAQIFGPRAHDEDRARAAKSVIITCEEIVTTEEIQKWPDFTAIPFYCVDAVVEVPYCSHTWPVIGYYVHDVMFEKDYVEMNMTRDGFLKWLDKYVFSCADHEEYCRKVGLERLMALSRLEKKYSLYEFYKR